jgi:hypothetical protein
MSPQQNTAEHRRVACQKVADVYRHTLPEVGLKTLQLDYKESRRTDQDGNHFRYRAKVKDTHDAQLGRWAWDVFLVTGP